MAAVAAIGLCGASEPPKEAAQAAREQQQSQGGRGAGRNPLYVKVIPTPKTQAEAASEQRESERKAALERSGLLTNIVLALFAFGQLVVTIITLRGLKHAETAAKAADAAADAAKRSVEIASETARKQLRAYVHVEAGRIDWLAERAVITVTVKNTGQTPAKWFDVAATSVVIEPSQATWGVPHLPNGNVWSGLAGNGSTRTVGVHPDPPILVGELKADNSVLLSVRGRVRYADIFDEIWETEFSYYRFKNMGPMEEPGEKGKLVQPNVRLRSYHKVEGASGADDS